MYEIIKEINSRGIEVIKVKDNSSGRTISLNSQVSPCKEIEKFLKNIKNNKCYFIIGSGNGTLLEELGNLKKNSKFYIVEMFSEIDYNEELKEELREKNIFFLHSDKLSYIHISDIIYNSMGMEFEILFHPNYDRLEKKLVDPIIDLIKMGTTTAIINKNTERFFKFDWLIEPILNLSVTESGKSIMDFKKYFEGKPIIIVASGPSLIDNLDFVEINKDKAYIIATGSAVNGLLNNGITPDFVTILDSSIINFTKHFENSKYVGPIISTGTTNHLILKHHKGELFFTNFAQDTITAEVRPDLLKVSTVSSVAIYTLLLAHFLEASEVYLVGQDLALKNGEYYAKGVNGSNSPKEKYQTIDIEGNIGGKVTTNLNLASMLENYNHVVSSIQKVNDKIKIYNLSKTGAKIKGVPYKDKGEVNLFSIIDKTWIPTNTCMKDLDYKLSLEYYNKLKKCKEEVDDIVRKIKKINSKVVTLKDLEKLLKLIKKIRQNDILEKHVLNMINSTTKSINNLFEFGFEGNFETNEERIEMLEKLSNFINVIQDYLNGLLQHEDWPEYFKEGEQDE